MGKTFSTGLLTNGISQDSSNNIGIGGAVNASYKLTVIGTTLTTGAATFSSSVTATNGIFTDGTQGLNVRAYTGGAGFGAIYSTGVTAGAGNFALAASSTQTILSGVDNVSMAINSAIKLYINNAGNVGIGTTSPGDLLQLGSSSTRGTMSIFGTSSGVPVLQLNNTNASGGNAWNLYAGLTAAGSFNIYDNNATLTRFTITNTGNVGIGTSSPSYTLDIQAGGSLSQRIRNNAAGGTATLLLETANTFSGTSQAYVQCIGTSGGGQSQLVFATAGASGDTSATERMRITSGGEICFGTTSQVGAGFVNIKNSGYNYNLITLQNTWVANAGNFLYFINSAGNQAGAIAHASASTVTYYTGPSDKRLKTNIQNWDENVLDLFKNINPVTFELINDNDGKKHKGFIAQEMVDKFPEAYGLDKDGLYAFNPSGYIPYLVKAIQEQQEIINNLSAKVTALENKNK